MDGAHTHHSLASLLSSFSHLHPGPDNTVIYGALEDKDHTHMVSLVLEHFSTIIVSKPGSYKKSDISMLRALFEQQAAASSKPVRIYLIEDNGEALKQAYALTPKHAAILVCGSFYLAGGVKAAYDETKEHYESQLA